MSEKTRNFLDNASVYLTGLVFVFYALGFYFDGNHSTEFWSVFFYWMGGGTTIVCLLICIYSMRGYKP